MGSELKHILLSRYKPGMITYLNANPRCFEEAMELALSHEKPFCWRAAWLIAGSVEKYRDQIQPYVEEIFDFLPDLEDGHQRELLKILIQLDLDEEHEGQLLDFAIETWEQVRKQPSVRHFAFKIMFDAIKKYPELTNEILMLTQPQYVNSLSPGIKNSVLKMKRAVENSIS